MNERSRSGRHLILLIPVLYSPQNIPDYDVDHSETLLYHVRLLEDLGEFKEALDILDNNAKQRRILDRTSIMEYRGSL